jgi:hypothetical protein
MQLKSLLAPGAAWAVKVAAALRTAVIDHKEEITNWLGVLMLLAVGVVWL